MSQLRHVELADGCESIKTSTNYVLAGWMTGHRAGSRACSRLNFCDVFFPLKKLSQLRGAEAATRRWASYEALSQQRSIEPATCHWASKVALSFELARRQWASKVALSFIIYIPMQSQPYNILNLGQNMFFLRETPWGSRDWIFSIFLKISIRLIFPKQQNALGSSAIVKVSEQTGAAPKPIPPRFPGSKYRFPLQVPK